MDESTTASLDRSTPLLSIPPACVSVYVCHRTSTVAPALSHPSMDLGPPFLLALPPNTTAHTPNLVLFRVVLGHLAVVLRYPGPLRVSFRPLIYVV